MSKTFKKQIGINIRTSLGCGLLLVALITIGRAYALNISEWSGWVQAVGSIGAIVAGFVVVNKQIKSSARLAIRERAELDDDRLTAAGCVGFFAHDLIDEVLTQMLSRVMITGYLMTEDGYFDFEGRQHALASIPLHELRSIGMIKGLLQLQRCLEKLRYLTSVAKAIENFDELDYEEWSAELGPVLQNSKSAMLEITAALDQSRMRLRES